MAAKTGHEMAAGSLASYATGFGLSLLLTLGAYFIIAEDLLSGRQAVFAVIFLALAQLMVQLVFFLHVGRESKPRWNLTVLLFAALVVVIVVFGSLWIMDNLNYNMMPDEMDNYMLDEEGIKTEHHQYEE